MVGIRFYYAAGILFWGKRKTMEEKYKIGTISKLLGIPIQTLHYFEECGFVTPSKDSKSNYRYYDAWDVNFLLDSRYLRSFEFSNAEIEEMINRDDFQKMNARFADQERKLLNLIQHYQDILDELHSEKDRINRHKDHLGKFKADKSPRIFFDPYRRNNDFTSMAKGEGGLPDITQWLDSMPIARATFQIPGHGLDPGKKEGIEYIWGFSVPTDRVRDLALSMEEHVEYCPSRQCLYTVFKAYGRNTFTKCLYEQVLLPIWDMGYEITESLIGRLLMRIHEDGVFTRYFEVWVPAEKME